MNIREIPLTPDNQQFDITLNNTRYKMRLLWRADRWFLDLMDENGGEIISGIPLVTGANLLAQYRWLTPGFGLVVIADGESNAPPGKDDLGYSSHLCVITEAI